VTSTPTGNPDTRRNRSMMKHEPNTDIDTDIDLPSAAEAPDTDFEALYDDPDTRALLTALASSSTPVQVLYLGRSNRGPRSRELRDLGRW